MLRLRFWPRSMTATLAAREGLVLSRRRGDDVTGESAPGDSIGSSHRAAANLEGSGSFPLLVVE